MDKVVSQVQAQNNNQWTQKKNSKLPYNITSKRPCTRPNVEPPYKPNDERPHWNDTYNASLVWNGPPHNPSTYRYGPSQKGKHIVCYRCGEIDHCANECPNPKKEKGYTPMCGNCCQLGHAAEECNAKSRNFPPSKRDYKENPPKLPLSNSRDVNCITQHMPFEQDVFATRART